MTHEIAPVEPSPSRRRLLCAVLFACLAPVDLAKALGPIPGPAPQETRAASRSTAVHEFKGIVGDDAEPSTVGTIVVTYGPRLFDADLRAKLDQESPVPAAPVRIELSEGAYARLKIDAPTQIGAASLPAGEYYLLIERGRRFEFVFVDTLDGKVSLADVLRPQPSTPRTACGQRSPMVERTRLSIFFETIPDGKEAEKTRLVVEIGPLRGGFRGVAAVSRIAGPLDGAPAGGGAPPVRPRPRDTTEDVEKANRAAKAEAEKRARQEEFGDAARTAITDARGRFLSASRIPGVDAHTRAILQDLHKLCTVAALLKGDVVNKNAMLHVVEKVESLRDVHQTLANDERHRRVPVPAWRTEVIAELIKNHKLLNPLIEGHTVK